ncbi:hypothetical protein HCA61_25715 [Rhodococcus sp. HNM0563]|uniref:DnaB-like helicase C-terminal domain-containing protein n=1 Tax=Rhodococcus sp. HNM0563 TaxID=2716339 RepID=UPI00146E8052|nr:hypothetical protein [Rhodococcus sp. HNM0563]
MSETIFVAEQVLLGRILEGDDESLLSQTVSALSPAAFATEAHRSVFQVICTLVSENRPVDLPSVAAELTEHNALGQVGGPSALAAMTTTSLSASARAPQQHLEALANREHMQRLATQMEQALDLIRDGHLATIDEVQVRLAGIFDTPSFQAAAVPDIGAQVQELRQELQVRLESGPGALDGVPTGWKDLDGGQDSMALVKGLKPGRLTILGARPGTGKTTAIVDWVRAACESGAGVILFSLEQTAAEITELLVVAECANLHREKLKDPSQLSDLAWDKVSESMARVASWNLVIDDTTRTLPRMRRMTAAARKKFQARGSDLHVMFEDYIQLTEASDAQQASQPRSQQISDIANGFKALSKDMNIHVVAAAQFNRNSADADRPPKSSELKGSGGLEEAADLILALHRPHAVDPQGATETPDELTILGLKSRHGRAGWAFPRTFLGEFARTSEPRPRQFVGGS